MAEESYSKNYFTLKNILIYLLVGIIVYGLIYYFVIAKKGGYNSNYVAPSTGTQEDSSKGMGY